MKRTGDQVRARRIPPGEALGDVERLRREVYFHEQGQQRDKSELIADGLDGSGTVIAVDSGVQAVASLRLHDFSAPTVQVEYGQLFQIDRFASAWPLERVVVGTRLAVQSDRRDKQVVDCLLEATYRYAQEQGIRFGVVACDPALHTLFEYYGFREYLPPAILADGSAVLRMVLVTDDGPHLHRCGSPLQYLILDPTAGATARAWLMRTFKLAD